MKYAPPFGASDPNAPYIDGNPALGIEGSPVPAAALEHTMREITHVIKTSGLTPSGEDLTQLYQAIHKISTGQGIAKHADTHKTGGADALTPAAIGAAAVHHTTPVATAAAAGHVKVGAGLSVDAGGTVAVKYGAAVGTACQGSDARLSDARAPKAHKHPVADITGVLPLANGGTARTDGAAPKLVTARNIALTGAVTGNVNFDGSGNVAIATKATGASLGFTQNLAANGWQKLPSGLIMQWGRFTCAKTDVTYLVTLPIAYTKGHYIALSCYHFTGVVGSMRGSYAQAHSLTQIALTSDVVSSSVANMELCWISVGC